MTSSDSGKLPGHGLPYDPVADLLGWELDAERELSRDTETALEAYSRLSEELTYHRTRIRLLRELLDRERKRENSQKKVAEEGA